MLQSKYFEDLDRFAVFEDCLDVAESDLSHAQGFVSVEYLRYVPVGNVSREQVDAYLASEPHEICCEITSACSLNCHVCIAHTPRASPVLLSINEFRRQLLCLPGRVERVTITGGEPTLHPDLPAFLEFCARLGKVVFLSTNGFNEAACMDALAAGDRVVVAVSLHGTRAVHDEFVGVEGSFDRAVSTIASVIRSGRRVHVLSTATSETVGGLGELSALLADMHVSEHRVNLVRPYGRVRVNPASFDDAARSLQPSQVSHKVSVKRADQPQLYLSCSGTMEARNGRAY